MKVTVAVLAMFVALSTAPAMASASGSAGSNSGFEVKKGHHTHHKRHQHMYDSRGDAVSAVAIG
jgi:hypothetical protein